MTDISSSRVEIRVISAAETMPLRLAILRPGRPPETAQFPGDHAADTRHFGAFVEGRLLGIASMYRAEMPERLGLRACQLRGMATAEEARGAGLGRGLIKACIEHAHEGHAEILWCNARIGAAGFYQKMGFSISGQEFEIPDVGPHFRMFFSLCGSNKK